MGRRPFALMERASFLAPVVLAALLLTALALFIRSGSMEAELATRGTAQLAADGQAWAGLTFKGRDATLTGTAPSAAAERLALESASRLLGPRVVFDDTGLIPVASPFAWALEKSRGGLVFTGFLPSEEDIQRVRDLATAGHSDLSVVGDIKLARGAPTNLRAATDFGIAALGKLAEGKVELVDSSLSISGVAPTAAVFEELSDTLEKATPSGFRLTLDIQPPPISPYLWLASLENGRLTISGVVPSRAIKTAIDSAATAIWTGAGVLDNATFASGAPAGFEEAGRFALGLLARLNQGRAQLIGLALAVNGRAKSLDDYDAVVGALMAAPAGVTLSGIDIQPATVSPYLFRAERAGGDLILSGYMPSAETRKTVLESASASAGGKVVDHLRIAAGVPSVDWPRAATLAVNEAAALNRGSIAITDQTMDVVGEAASSEAYTRLRDIGSRPLPMGVKLRRVEVAPPSVSPYRFAATLAANQLTLEGYVPTAEARIALASTMQRKFPGGTVTDRVTFASGAPADFTSAVDGGLQALSRLQAGRIELVGSALTVSGTVFFPGAAERVEADLSRAVRPPIVVKSALTAAPDGPVISGAACQDRVKAVLTGGKIDFAPSTATIMPESLGRLDRVTAVLRQCPDAKVEVGGHTDSTGDPGASLALSRSRADAVTAYLATGGILRERMDSVGYGDARPIASNGTEEGRALNRRIEISVKD